MITIAIYIIFNILLLASAFTAGVMAARSGNRPADIAALSGVIILFAQIALFFYPEIEILIFNFADYAYFRWWGMAGAALLGGTAFNKIKGRDRIALWIFEIIVVCACFYLIWQSFFGVSADFVEIGFEEGICRQSTDYTCAPASCVTYLKRIGIASGEREMAALCATQRLGSAYVNIYRGLKLKLAGYNYEVILERVRPEKLLEITTPFITSLYIHPGVLHTVTVLETSRSGVVIAETVRGARIDVTPNDFLKRWDGLALYAKKK